MIVLFDMFGVIARDQSREVMDTMSVEPEFWDAYWAHRPAYDRGDVTAEEYWRLVGHPPLDRVASGHRPVYPVRG